MLAKKNLDEFINEIIKEKNVTDLSPEVVEQLRSDLRDRLEDRINAAILDKVPEEKLEEFENLLDGQDQGKLQEFISAIIPDLDVVVSLELLSFRKLYLS